MERGLILGLNNYLTSSEPSLNEEFLKEYERHLQVSKASKETYLTNARKFINWLGNKELTEDTILNYRCYLVGNYKGTAINTHIASLKSLFNYVELLGGKNLARGLKGVRVSKQHKRDSLTIDQVKSIYTNANVNNIEGARANAIIKLLIGTGLRECELVNANIGDIATKGNQRILYIQGKGYNNSLDNKDEYVILTPSVLNAIQDYLKFRTKAKDNEPLFTSVSDRNNGQRLTTRTIRNIVKGTFKDNGIVSERITTHSTRHTAITLSLLGGATLQETQVLARHSNINTTLIYAHNLNRLESNGESKIEELLNNGNY